jgi:hypothetical protein
MFSEVMERVDIIHVRPGVQGGDGDSGSRF